MLAGAESDSVQVVRNSAFELLDLLPPTEQRRLGAGRCALRKRAGRLAAAGLLGAGVDARAPLALGDAVVGQADAAFGQGDAAFGQGDALSRKFAQKMQKRAFKNKSEQLAKKQIRAQGLWMKRNGNNRIHDHSMVEAIDKTMGLVPMRRDHGGKGGVGAKWKRYTAEAICKIGFGNLRSSFDAKAAKVGGSRSHALKCTWVMGEVIDEAQDMSIKRELKRPLAYGEASGQDIGDLVDDFQINNNMFDETVLWIRTGRGNKRQRRVLATATQVTRRAPGGSVQDVDILRSPGIMESYTAACCAKLLAQPDDRAGLLPEGEAAPKAKYFASLTITDAHSVNKLLSKWVAVELARQAGLNPTRFHVASYCAQHKTGNAVQQVTEYLGIIKPGFALATCLSTGDIADSLDFELRMVLQLELVVVDPAVAALDAPDEMQQNDFFRELFEQCYVRSSGLVATKSTIDEQEAKRRMDVEEIVLFFAASRGRCLRHACPPGCCDPESVVPAADRNASVTKGFALVKRFINPCISEPAANKYTKVDPVMRKLALATNFFSLLRRAFARKFNDKGDSESEVSDISVDAAIGTPKDTNRHWRKVKHIKLNRCYTFLKSRSSEYLPLIWLCVCSCLMTLHYKFFKYGTWYSHRKEKDRCNIFDFCSDEEQNPCCAVLSTLASMLLDPEGAGRRPLALLFMKFGGTYSAWPQHVRQYLEGAICIAFSVVWRKLFFVFKQYPWLLVPAFDKRCSELYRRAKLHQFLNAALCCLDPGLCALLRALTTNIDDYLETVLCDFLTVLFERVVVTSTQVELIFAGLSKYTESLGGGGGMPTLSAKYKISAFAQAVNRWRSENPNQAARSNNWRAPWMFPVARGARTNHLHILAKKTNASDGLWPGPLLGADAFTRFQALSAEEQDKLRADAALARAAAKLEPSQPDMALADVNGGTPEGPFGVATRSGEPFPIRPAVVNQALVDTNVSALARKWCAKHKSHATALANFPKTIALPETCVGECTRDLRLPDNPDGSRGELKPAVIHLLHHLQLACRYATRTKRDPTILLQFADCDGTSLTEYLLVTATSHTNNSCFEATHFRMVPCGDAPAFGQVGRVPPPFLLRFDCRDVATGFWPSVDCETNLARRLLSLSPTWEISQALNRQTDMAGVSRLVTAIETLPYQRLLELQEEEKVRSAAMRSLRKVMRLPAHRKSGGKRRAINTQKIDDISSESEKSGDSEVEKYWCEIMESLRAKATQKNKKNGSSKPAPKTVCDPIAASASGSVDPPAPLKIAARAAKTRDWVDAVGGGSCFFDSYDGGSHGKPYKNLMFQCPRHENCMKTRGCGVFSEKLHGELEPLAFLHAWRDMEVPPSKSHRQCTPSKEAVADQVLANLAALAELNAKFRC